MKVRVFAGLGGGFGGANDHGVYDVRDHDEALELAYELAVEEYQSYEGEHGILSWGDCREDLIDSNPDLDIDDEDVDAYYNECIEGWIDYYIEDVDENDLTDT